MGLLNDDLANCLKTSSSLVSIIFTTWIRLMPLELKYLLNWWQRDIIKRKLPLMFRKHYPNCCITIDCSKLFIEITSSLDKASACWSNYKHHYTVKCLIYITPNGTVSVFSNCHGGRAANVFIVQIVDFYKDCSLEIKSWPIGDSKFKTC